jgi:putative membrane protein
MAQEENTGLQLQAPSSTDLAIERTLLAHERTLLAWLRTAISMISFGFTIYKFLGEMSKTNEEQQRFMTPRIVGMIMISFGLIALILAHLQQQRAVRKLKKNFPGIQKSFSSTMSFLVLVFGLLLFLGALFRQ